MSFATEKIKPGSFKICLLELDTPIVTETFINYSAGIWKNVLSGNLGRSGITVTGSDGLIGFYEEQIPISYFRIGSLVVDDEEYTQQTSISDCVTQVKSFYYDNTTLTIYYHFADFGIPWGKIVRIGVICGFADKVGTVNGAYYDDIYYDPRVVNIPAMRKAIDPLFWGILQYTGGSATLINSDGFFETFIERELIGQPARLYWGFDGLAFSEFRKVFSGIIEDYSFSRDTFTLNIIDDRKFLSRSIPIRKFDKSEYPDISDDNAGTVKPLAWGVIRGAPLVCLDEMNPTATDYRFFVCDTTDHSITGVTNVILNGIVVDPGDWTYADGVVTMAASVFVSDPSGSGDDYYVEDNLDSVTADFVGFAGITKGLDVIKDILLTYANVQYIASNYDLTEWAAATLVSRDVGIYLNEETPINEVIQKICVAEDGIFLVKDDGLYTFRIFDYNRTPNRTIKTDEWLNEPTKKYQSKELLSSVKVQYNKHQDNDTWKSITNSDYQKYVLSKYKLYREKSFETVLVDDDDALAKTESIMYRSKEIYPVVSRKTKTQNIDLEIMDFIDAEHSRESDEIKDWSTWEIIGINKDLNNAEITLDMRWVKDIIYPSDLSDMWYRVDGTLE